MGSGEPLSEAFDLVPEDETRFETQHDVASVGPDEYLLAWGEVEYYLLEGARPGFDRLPGLFDREGFEP